MRPECSAMIVGLSRSVITVIFLSHFIKMNRNICMVSVISVRSTTLRLHNAHSVTDTIFICMESEYKSLRLSLGRSLVRYVLSR